MPPPPNQDMTDDYVVNLLKQDAKVNSSRYLQTGVSAFLPPHKPASNAPRANTRFLRNIIRETDSHNAALLAKEKAEAEARLRALRSGRSGRRGDDEARLHRSERGDGRERKRRKVDRDDRSKTRSRSRSRSPTRKHRGEDRRSKDDEPRSRRRSHRDERSPEEGSDEDRRRRRARRRRDHDEEDSAHRQTTRASQNSRRDGEDRTSRRISRSERERSPRRRRRESHSDRSRSRSQRRDRRETHKTNDHRRSPQRSSPATMGHSDSDPLEGIVGPLPPPTNPQPRIRGRGVTTKANMDAHFATDYDPKAEGTLNHLRDSNNGSWDDAVEAFRDMQRWKALGAERLKQAGFSDDAVSRWEKGGEKTEDDVVWKKRGEDREWDRGKMLDDEDGSVVLRPPDWGRLT